MLLLENVLLAINGIRANRIRSLLTMLGIIIGIASVVAIMGVGDAMTQSTMNSLSFLGASEITIGIQSKSESDEEDPEGYAFREVIDTSMKDDDKLSPEEIQIICDQFPDRLTGVKLENSVGDAVIPSRGKEIKVRLMGENSEGFKGKKLKMLAGRAFTDKDQKEGRKVAVISDKAVKEALKTDNEAALGQEITVVCNDEFHHFTVVGVYYYDENDIDNMMDPSGATSLYIPVSTSFAETHNKELYTSAVFLFANGVDSEALMDDVSIYINDRFYRNNRNFKAKSFSNVSLIKEFEQSMQMASMGVAVIAAISLLVGGIGVMNIMLVSIQERTREIGTRKALGATNSSIRMQFIIEAIVLCIVGGVIGIFLGLGMGYIGTVVMSGIGSGGGSSQEVVYNIPHKAIIISVIFSATIGVFFGYYPANKAAKMNPIDALRYE